MKEHKSTPDLPFYLPPPMPSLAYTTPLPLDQHRSFDPLPIPTTIHTPLIELLDLNLLSLVIPSNKPLRQETKKKEKQPFVPTEKEVYYDVLVKDSFDHDTDEIKHPNCDIPVKSVIELWPHQEVCSNSCGLLAVVDNGEIDDFVCESGKIPSKVSVMGKEYVATANDISDYLYVYIKDGKAYYRDIGASLVIKRSGSGKK